VYAEKILPFKTRQRTSNASTSVRLEQASQGPEVQNWKGMIGYHPDSVQVVKHVDDIVRIVKDTKNYPSPVRGKGSHHSTTRCIVAEGGTVVDLSQMNRILKIDEKARTITMEAGVLHIDAAKELEKHNLQFYVNIELGNMTVGSGSCCGTKDASFYSSEEGYEYGQVCSYAIAFKAVLPDGRILEVNPDKNRELLEAMRTSFGMLGVVYEVTFRVKPLKPMAMEHIEYTLEEFAASVDQLVDQNRSLMLYLFPFDDKVVVERRYEGEGRATSNSWQWRLRNFVWETFSPFVGVTVSTFIPVRSVRYWLVDRYHSLSRTVLTTLVRGRHTSPADQIIRYPPKGGYASYTFSIWAFPQKEYPQTIKAYFQFCKDYYAANGFRCDMLNVGYAIVQDRSALFSYTRNSPVLTLDPVGSGAKGWEGFLTAYNEFCIQHHGTFLLNQTWGVTPLQAKAAFGPEIEEFKKIRAKYDPDGRFYSDFFRNLFE
jgi:L-gulonolactone oxidase